MAALLPAQGLKDLYGTEVPPNLADLVAGQTKNELVSEIPKFNSTFLEVIVTY